MTLLTCSVRALAVEPYLGGSHEEFLRGLARHSRRGVDVFGLPATKWKWRMRGGAVLLADDIPRPFRADALLCSDFLDLAAFLGLRPDLAALPSVAYFHENQLTYPVRQESERDYHYAFTNISTCLAADRVLFNSAFHRREFLEAVPGLLKRMPDCRPSAVAERIEAKSGVLWPGVDLEEADRGRAAAHGGRRGPLTVVWSHRWEFDKAPEAFFRVLFQLAEEGADFRLCLLGERFRDAPGVFAQAKEHLRGRIVHEGFAESRAEYFRLLAGCDVFVSTAVHEFFGMAAAEAMAAGCCPALPDRLAYPELLKECDAEGHLYEDEGELKARLRRWMENPAEARAADLRPRMGRFGQRETAAGFDAEVDALLLP